MPSTVTIDYSQARAANADREWSPEARRQRTAYNALQSVYGDAAGDPESAARLQATQAAKDTADAQQQLGLVTSLQKVRDSGGDVSGAFQQLKPLIASHVDPQHMAGLEQLIATDPSKLDAIRSGLVAANPGLAKVDQGQQKININLGTLEEKATHNRATEGIGQQNADTRATGVSNAYDLGGRRLNIAQQNADTSKAKAGLLPSDADGPSASASYLADRVQANGMSELRNAPAGDKALAVAELARRAQASGNSGVADVLTAQATKARGAYLSDLAKTTPNSAGGKAQSLSVAIEHSNQFKTLVDALQNGDQNTINRIQNTLGKDFGDVDVTNVEALGPLLGDEIAKAVIPGAGGVRDREEIKRNFTSARSTDQLLGAINTYTGALTGQLHGARQKAQALSAEKEFDANLTPAAKASLEAVTQASAPPAAQPAGAPAPQSSPGTAPAAGAPNGKDYSHLF